MSDEEAERLWHDLTEEPLCESRIVAFEQFDHEDYHAIARIANAHTRSNITFRLCYCIYWVITRNNLEEAQKSRLLDMLASPDHENTIVVLSILKSMSSKLVYPIAPDGQAK